MNSMKRQEDMIPEDKTPKTERVQHVTGEEQRGINNSTRKNEVAGPEWKQHKVVDVPGVESKIMP